MIAKLTKMIMQMPQTALRVKVSGKEKGKKQATANALARYLLDGKVIVLPVPIKIGQVCYQIFNKRIIKIKVKSITYEPTPYYDYIIRFNNAAALYYRKDGSKNEEYSWETYLTREEAKAKIAEVWKTDRQNKKNFSEATIRRQYYGGEKSGSL